MSTSRSDLDALDFYSSETFEKNGYPHPIGEHFCMGANLARLELEIVIGQLVERIEEIELAGPVRRLRSSFVGGVKSMPIRYELRA